MSLLRRFALSRPKLGTHSSTLPGKDVSAPASLLVEHSELACFSGGGLERAWQLAKGQLESPCRSGASEVIFLDTETTGLSASQLPFVLGVLAVDLSSGKMELIQWALRAREAEVEMLRRFCAWLAVRPLLALSSFNGASFDLPLLRRRMSRLGLLQPAALERGAPHLDLLHLARRLWRERLPDCRLISLEAARLGRRRRGDIPSALIPAVFADFLARPACPDARAQLERVEHHNRLDLWSLPELLGDFGRTLSAPKGWVEKARVARHFRDLERTGWARPVVEEGLVQALAGLRPGQLDRVPGLRSVAFEAARLGRLRGDVGYCSELLRTLHKNHPDDPEICRARAIHLEHRAKDLNLALEVALASRQPEQGRIARLRDRCSRAHASQAVAPAARGEKTQRCGPSGTFSEPREPLLGSSEGQAVRGSSMLRSPRACLRRVRSSSDLGFGPI